MSGVKDRLSELQSNQQLLKSDKKDKSKGKKSDMVRDMDGLQERVRAVEAKLTSLKRNVNDMETLQKNIISSPFCDKKKVHEYEQIVNRIQEVSAAVRVDLRDLEKEERGEKDGDSALDRIKIQQLNRLTNSLAALTNQFFKAQAEYMDKIKSRMRTQLEVTKGTSKLSEDEMNDILEKDNYNAFTQNYISDVQDAESQLRQMEDRQKEILALEKSVFEVNQLFQDMSVLVHDQGVTLDSIEANVTTAAVNVEEGQVQLKKAKKLRTKSRKCKIILAVVGLVAVVVVVLIILGAAGVI